ncbi:hypothetical protein H0I76_16880 [Limibaculum sp. M0105]|uniref:3-hydroxylacyl-ACP dehydratase n=1 Tax=Thermohalobaculum xanthum TaxID=2753746 RepID=A0A8J7SEU7_9RHOB|nr:hypothetical protein [Thermohalobaculum xanthum]MBK0400877.1 hypothetical protein [Thermohalobaculum xanthum]
MLEDALDRMPHSGPMRLIESVLASDLDRVRCIATDHRSPTYPLRLGGMLYGATMIEIGAQAAAIHASLHAVGAAHTGLILALTDVVISRDLVESEGRLEVGAERIEGDENGARYRFEVVDGEGVIVSGELLLSMRRRDD